MKKLGLLSIMVSMVFLAGCSSQPTSSEQNANDTQSELEKKSGDTTKKGNLRKVDDKFYLEESGGAKFEVESYAYELDDYANQTITVTGQYSGDTLFIGKITQ